MIPEHIISRFHADVLKKHDFSGAVYVNSDTRITGIICPDHGEFAQYASALRKGMSCQECGKIKRSQSTRMTADEFFARCQEAHGGRYAYQDDYAGMNEYIFPTCPEHGQFKIRAAKHLYVKQGCAQCGNKRKGSAEAQAKGAASRKARNAKNFMARCLEVHGDRYEYPDKAYPGAREKIRIVCPQHGEFEQQVYRHLQGRGCPKCGAYDPRWERELAEALEIAGFTVERNVRILDGQEIDIYLPDRQFGIELHGLYWHRRREQAYHYKKWKSAHDQGIRLIQVFEDEWANKQNIVLSRIDAMLGRCETYDARKLSVEVIKPARGNQFLEERHIQGRAPSGQHYALTDGDEVIALAVFGKERKGASSGAQNGGWEVMRYASIGRVRGGFSRLLKAFRRTHTEGRVVSYCDLRYGNGDLYKACGFVLEGHTPPDYWWVKPGRMDRTPRYKFQKHKLKDIPELAHVYKEGMGEKETCEAAGLIRVFGTGSQKWILPDERSSPPA
jgi:hypothetical protein